MIKVFIIDDNVLVRFALTQLLNQEGDIVVVGDAPPSSKVDVEVKQAKPDIIIFDIPLPRDTGIRELKSLHKLHLPAIVFTKSDKDIARDLIPLLEAGAVGFVMKPDLDTEIVSIREQIVYELRRNVRERLVKPIKHLGGVLFPPKVVAIGSSTGGPEALVEVFSHLPHDFSAGMVVVQHMPAGFTARFANRLAGVGPVMVKEAETGDVVKAGVALLAPGDFHMEFQETVVGGKRQASVKLNQDPPQWKLRPTVDKMMTSIAPIYQSRCVGVILTGMGEDGVVGMRAIKQLGGKTLVQDKSTSVVFGMGQEVIKNNLADEVLPLDEIPYRIAELVK